MGPQDRSRSRSPSKFSRKVGERICSRGSSKDFVRDVVGQKVLRIFGDSGVAKGFGSG